MTDPLTLTVGANVKAQIEADLKIELSAFEMYIVGLLRWREEGDNASRELFERILKDEEGHIDWLEAGVHQMKELGYERYLSQQIREGE